MTETEFARLYDLFRKGIYIKAQITLAGNYTGTYSTIYRVSITAIGSAKAKTS